LLKKLNKEY